MMDEEIKSLRAVVDALVGYFHYCPTCERYTTEFGGDDMHEDECPLADSLLRLVTLDKAQAPPQRPEWYCIGHRKRGFGDPNCPDCEGYIPESPPQESQAGEGDQDD